MTRSSRVTTLYRIMQVFVGVAALVIMYRIWNGAAFLSYAGMLPSLFVVGYWLVTGKAYLLGAISGLAGAGWHMYYAGLTFVQIAFYVLLLAVAFGAGYAPARRSR